MYLTTYKVVCSTGFSRFDLSLWFACRHAAEQKSGIYSGCLIRFPAMLTYLLTGFVSVFLPLLDVRNICTSLRAIHLKTVSMLEFSTADITLDDELVFTFIDTEIIVFFAFLHRNLSQYHVFHSLITYLGNQAFFIIV